MIAVNSLMDLCGSIMNATLLKAYTIIYDTEPDVHMEEWQIAKFVLEIWDVPKLGEDLAKETLFALINHIYYPAQVSREIVGEAELKLPELFPEIGEHDPDMHIAEWLENKYLEQKKEKMKSSEKISLK